jgi:endonuclease I
MPKARKNSERENRIEMEIIVDAYGPEERARGCRSLESGDRRPETGDRSLKAGDRKQKLGAKRKR